MIKSMAKMLGPNHPLAGMLNNKSPEDLEKMMKMMSKFSGVITYLIKAFVVVKKYKYYFIALLVAIIAYYFY